MSCAYKLSKDGRDYEFNTVGELETFMLSNHFNIAFSTINNQADAVTSLLSPGKKIEFRKEKHEYFHHKDGVETSMKPTSKEIEDQLGKYMSPSSPKGEKSRDTGIEFHDIASNVINAINDGKPLPIHTGIEAKWVEHVKKLYNKLSEGGKNKIISEFMIGNTTYNIAGTVDIAVIKPNGDVVIYDFKGSAHDYDSNIEKKNSNNLQMNIYKRMMEIGDEYLGMKPVKVTGAYLLPMLFTFSEGAIDPTTGNHVYTLDSFDASLGELNFEDPEYYPNHANGKAMAASVFQVDQSGALLKGSLKMPGAVDFSNIIADITGTSDNAGKDPQLDAEARAKDVGLNETTKEYYYFNNNKQTYFTDKEAKKNPSIDGHRARVAEIKKNVSDKLAANLQNKARRIAELFVYRSLGDESLNDPSNKASEFMKQVADMYDPDTDMMMLASEIPGLENAGNDVLVVFRNVNRKTGEYSTVDLLSITNDQDMEIAMKQRQGHDGNTIFGKYMSNNGTATYFQRKGEKFIKAWPNNKKNNKMLKLGAIAMTLKKNNPNLSVGKLLVAGVNSNKPAGIFMDSMESVIEQMKLMQIVADDKTSGVVIDNKDLNALIHDPKLMEVSYYGGDQVAAYLDLFGGIWRNSQSKKNLEKHTPTKEWFKSAAVTELFPKTANHAKIYAYLQEVKEDNAKKILLKETLEKRLYDIMHKFGKDPNKLMLDKEYKFLITAIAQLGGLVNEFKSQGDIGVLAKLFRPVGKTGISIFDSFVSQVKEVYGRMNIAFANDYSKRAKVLFEKFYKDMGVYTQVNATGMSYTAFEKLLEKDVFKTDSDSSKTITRMTGRFLQKGSAEYGKLTQTEKDFIEDYCDLIEEGFTRTMSQEQKEAFKTNWQRGHIPLFKTSSITHYKKIFKGEGTLWAKVKAFTGRKLDSFRSYDDDINLSSSGFTEMVDKVKHQIPLDANDPLYGNSSRMDILGINEDGTARTLDAHEREITSPFETDLELTMALLFENSYRKEYLEPLMSLQETTKSMLLMAEHEHFGKFPNVIEALNTYVDAVFFKKNQTKADQEWIAKILGSAGSITSSLLLGYNVTNWVKNYLAGHLHTFSKAWTKQRGNTDGPALEEVTKAYGIIDSFQYRDKIEQLMYQFGMTDVDIDMMARDSKHKAAGNGPAGNRLQHMGNRWGDYHHRAVMLVSQMIYDGTWDAYVRTKVDGELIYTYDETKDKRFTDKSIPKEKRDSFKAFLVESMKTQNLIGEDGKMKQPYASQDLTRFKDEANQVFQVTDLAAQALYNQYYLFRFMFGMKSFLISKGSMYYQNTMKDSSRKRMIQVERVNKKTGLLETNWEWQGDQVEGLYQTIGHLLANIGEAVKTQDLSITKDFFQTMAPVQKENLRRTVTELGVVFALIAAAGALFDDEEDPMYKMMAKVANEIFILDHIAAIPGVGAGSAFPTIGMLTSIINQPLEFTMSKGTGVIKPFYAAYDMYSYDRT